MSEAASGSFPIDLRLQGGRFAVVTGCLLCLVSTLFLPWTRAQAFWKEFPLLGNLELGSVTVGLTDNIPLAIIAAILSAAGLAGLAWRSRAWTVALLVSALLLLVFIAYLVGLSAKAYETMGFFRRLLDSLREVPYLGAIAGWVEEIIRNNVTFSVRPLAGLFLFPISTLTIGVGGLLLRPRTARRRGGEWGKEEGGDKV